MPDLASLIELAGTGNEFFYNGLLGGEDGQGGLYVHLGRQGGAEAPLSDPFDVSLMMDDTDYWYFNGDSYWAVDVEGLDVSSAVISKLRSMYPDATFNLRTPLTNEPGDSPIMLWDGGFMSLDEFTQVIPVGSHKLVALNIPLFYNDTPFNPICQVTNNGDGFSVVLFYDSETLEMSCWNAERVVQFRPAGESDGWQNPVSEWIQNQLGGLFGDDDKFSWGGFYTATTNPPDIVLSWT